MVARHHLADTGAEAVVDSAGISDEEAGNPIDPRQARVLAAAGYRTDDHVARQITPEWLAQRDLAVAMTARHYRALERMISELPAEAAPELRMLREFDPRVAGVEGAGVPAPDVEDPWYGEFKDFEETLETIEVSVPGITERLRALAAKSSVILSRQKLADRPKSQVRLEGETLMTRLMTRQNWSALRLGFAALLVAAMSVFAFAPAASAHDQLVSSNPEDGAELDQQPKWLEMNFSGDIQEVGSEVKVIVDGKDVSAGELTVEGKKLSVALPDDLKPGDYEVTWRVVSQDGHPISGDYAFTIKDAEGAGGDVKESTEEST